VKCRVVEKDRAFTIWTMFAAVGDTAPRYWLWRLTRFVWSVEDTDWAAVRVRQKTATTRTIEAGFIPSRKIHEKRRSQPLFFVSSKNFVRLPPILHKILNLKKDHKGNHG